jgi:hypothetical protein
MPGRSSGRPRVISSVRLGAHDGVDAEQLGICKKATHQVPSGRMKPAAMATRGGSSPTGLSVGSSTSADGFLGRRNAGYVITNHLVGVRPARARPW